MDNVYPLFKKVTQSTDDEVCSPPLLRVETSSPFKFHPANVGILCRPGGGLQTSSSHFSWVHKTMISPVVHKPVLVKEITAMANTVPSGLIIDATVGLGGHSLAILSARSDITILGIDRDQKALDEANKNLKPFKGRYNLVQARFSQINEVSHQKAVFILFDLGLSSLQLEDYSRGFSFYSNSKLDMTMGADYEKTAWHVVNQYSVKALQEIFSLNGETKQVAYKVAQEIVKARPIEYTNELVEIIMAAKKGRRGKIHPATKIFQAIRREVNNEHNELINGLKSAQSLIAPNGIIAVISYHSLEDRVTKVFFDEITGHIKVEPVANFSFVISRKAIKPSEQELADNPRARSARLRAVRRNSK